MATDLHLPLNEFLETNKKVFLQFEAESNLVQFAVASSINRPENNLCSEVIIQEKPMNSVVDVLMNKQNSFTKLKKK